MTAQTPAPPAGDRVRRTAEVTAATNAVVTVIDPPLPHAPEGPLAGVRVGLKDSIDTAGVRTTCGSAYFADRVPDVDAEVVSRLTAAGAQVVAKLNLSEFALGLTGTNSLAGPSQNPWDGDRVPGGSSSGSAVAVAAGLVDLALGTDTGGSVRVPAAACGVTGLRPGVSVVPDAGTFPVCELVDTVGPIARDVPLVARAFAVLAGRAVRELTPAPPVRIGVPESWTHPLDPGVAAVVAAAAQVFAAGGSELVPVRVPGTGSALDVLYTLVYADVADLHVERLAHPELFQPETLTRVRVGEGLSDGHRAEALEARAEFQRALEEVFASVDVLLSPTLPVDVPTVATDEDVLALTRRLALLTAPWSLHAGPTLALPVGRHPVSGMPVGAQLTAPVGGEDALLDAGAWFQQRTDWHTATPPCSVD
ncbi:amidase [Modestobacter sp. VKM Ac-2986]|uniref:amidase n=1 Tax=Modestobacter sp. VKM Ac-2986 TaxID=3004140 RepID=UPI0022AA2DEA|nr:amidase [Modestobacter sp. VKM Ac-2986]MCZ2827658.1 amidase [Modestobacter sp. VKM Ac-2986]